VQLTKTIRIAHSPDSDDAFMFYAIKEKKIDLQGFNFEFASDEIAKLNQLALDGQDQYQILALSFASLFQVEDEYELMPSGCSFAGKDYGPKIVSSRDGLLRFARNDGQHTRNDLIKIAIPGKNTSAFLITQHYLKENYPNKFKYVFCAYDEVFDLLESKKVDASLLIHEAQLKYQEMGFELLVDFGVWWHKNYSGINMPLGCNAIKKDLGSDCIAKLNKLLKESILWAKENFSESMEYSRKFAQNNLDDANAIKYLDMYVNDTTIELKEDDYKSIQVLRKYFIGIN
jgi:1,4-dihydroxy-6-naphthoate synthase